MPYMSSVSLRLQRVTTENAHVSVPLSEEHWQPNPDGSGTFTINTEKLLATAIELGSFLRQTGRWKVMW